MSSDYTILAIAKD